MGLKITGNPRRSLVVSTKVPDRAVDDRVCKPEVACGLLDTLQVDDHHLTPGLVVCPVAEGIQYRLVVLSCGNKAIVV